jgi:hypothetical protein
MAAGASTGGPVWPSGHVIGTLDVGKSEYCLGHHGRQRRQNGLGMPLTIAEPTEEKAKDFLKQAIHARFRSIIKADRDHFRFVAGVNVAFAGQTEVSPRMDLLPFKLKKLTCIRCRQVNGPIRAIVERRCRHFHPCLADVRVCQQAKTRPT